MADEVILLGFWASPFGMRCRIALEEKGVPYEYKEQDVWNKSPLLLQSNPVHKKIPVLIHNGKAVCESLVILQYIDHVWPAKAPLMPADPYKRAQARFWADFIDNKVCDCWSRVWKRKGEVGKREREELVEALKLLDGMVREEGLLGGGSLGYVDIVLAPFISWFPTFQQEGNFRMETECPELATWAMRCRQRESVARTLPDPERVRVYMGQLKRKFGLARA